MSSRRNRRSGFTLIELLVVVAVISLLISILMPALGRAREQSRLVYCANNLRSIWTGVLTYALEYKDRLPFMENVNLPSASPGTGPNADPFDERFPTTVGVVLSPYVGPKTWVCPSAVRGFPREGGAWKFTYSFGASEFFGGIGTVTPYDSSNTSSLTSNYWPFDGRPLKKLDLRRYVSFGLNQNERGKWSVRFPLVADLIEVESAGAPFVYPHRGRLDSRTDLENAQFEFEARTGDRRAEAGLHELHADEDRVRVFLTRSWQEFQNY